MTNQFEGAVDARLIERSPARRALRCRRAGAKGGWEAGGGGGGLIPAWGMQGHGERGGEMEWGCLMENVELDLAPKSLDLGLHLPCKNTQGLPNFSRQTRFPYKPSDPHWTGF